MNDAETMEFLSLLRSIDEHLRDLNDKIDDVVSWKEDVDALLDHSEATITKLNEICDSIQEQTGEVSQTKDTVSWIASAMRSLHQ
ncbi:MAG: hypothetical protein PHI40_00545 [Caldisericia bacterium]|nr:hypothetical protein [Caldisericia bacterium]MDD4613887.1 hypothetical protein [Caldisericia bacterium]